MRFALVSGKGGREENEDSIGRYRKNGIYCFALADGLGGHSGGETASSLAVKTVINCFDARPAISGNYLEAYIDEANRAVKEKENQNPQMRGMSTTLVTLVSDGETAVWGHCGDSRLYRFKKNLIQEVTDDHSVAFSSFLSGEIEYDDIRRSPDQNKLIRTIGGNSESKPEIYPEIRIDKKTSFLLCSDGFWTYVDEDFMEYSRRKAKSPKEWLGMMLEERKLNAPQDADNYSAIAVFA